MEVGSPDAARLRERLAALHRIVARTSGSVAGDRRALLAEALDALDLDFASVAHFDGETAYPISSLTRGPADRPLTEPTPSSMLLGAIVADARETVAIADLAGDRELRDHVQVREFGVRRYVGTPIDVTGSGTYVLTMGSTAAHTEPFRADDLLYVELLAALFAQSLRDELHERSIEHLAFHCRLTGLPLEERLHERAAELAGTHGAYSLIAITIDIGRILSEFDHASASRIVTGMARRIEFITHAPFTAYRGIDADFFLLGENVALARVEETADRLRASLAASFPIEPHDVTLQPAVALAISRDGESVAATIGRSIDALQGARARAGVPRRLPAGDAAERRRRRLLVDVRAAAERDELRVQYQPVVTLGRGTICGVEALMRWQHPELGPIGPDEFIPLAEENESIVALGTWILRRAAHFARTLEDGGHHLAVAVNVASAQLHDTAFIDRVRFAARDAGITPSAFELEITETAALRDLAAATNVLAECRALGVRVALDDFGTAYSSLAYLRDLPSDIVKIDRSFVGALTSDARAAAIASATIVLAHRLGREVQAEGVETAAQRRWLVEERCDRAQGYLFGKPVDAAVLLANLDEGASSAG